MTAAFEKRTVDMRIIGEWVAPGSRVLDLGCGSGELLAYLGQAKGVTGIGVDLDFGRISACVRRGVIAHQGDMTGFMRQFPDGHFDRIICSRTVQELQDPAAVIMEALRAGSTVTVGFVNHAFWKNRLGALFRGRKLVNDVYPTSWFESRPANPVSIADFEDFCALKAIRIERKAHFLGDWKTPCPVWPNLLAGYALYDLARK